MAHASSQALQLRTLSIHWHLCPSGLKLLSSLPQLEGLCVRGFLYGAWEGVQLPSVHTLQGSGLSGQVPASWQPGMRARGFHDTLHAFPGLLRLEGVCITDKARRYHREDTDTLWQQRRALDMAPKCH